MVELEGFEPSTSCLPDGGGLSDPVHGRPHRYDATASQAVGVRQCILLSVGEAVNMQLSGRVSRRAEATADSVGFRFLTGRGTLLP